MSNLIGLLFSDPHRKADVARAVIGKRATCLREVAERRIGVVEVDGRKFKAALVAGSHDCAQGERVRVVGFDGRCLRIESLCTCYRHKLSAAA